MVSRYLKENKIEMRGMPQIGGIEDGYLFEIYPTTRGDIWFRLEMKF